MSKNTNQTIFSEEDRLHLQSRAEKAIKDREGYQTLMAFARQQKDGEPVIGYEEQTGFLNRINRIFKRPPKPVTSKGGEMKSPFGKNDSALESTRKFTIYGGELGMPPLSLVEPRYPEDQEELFENARNNGGCMLVEGPNGDLFMTPRHPQNNEHDFVIPVKFAEAEIDAAASKRAVEAVNCLERLIENASEIPNQIEKLKAESVEIKSRYAEGLEESVNEFRKGIDIDGVDPTRDNEKVNALIEKYNAAQDTLARITEDSDYAAPQSYMYADEKRLREFIDDEKVIHEICFRDEEEGNYGHNPDTMKKIEDITRRRVGELAVDIQEELGLQEPLGTNSGIVIHQGIMPSTDMVNGRVNISESKAVDGIGTVVYLKPSVHRLSDHFEPEIDEGTSFVDRQAGKLVLVTNEEEAQKTVQTFKNRVRSLTRNPAPEIENEINILGRLEKSVENRSYFQRDLDDDLFSVLTNDPVVQQHLGQQNGNKTLAPELDNSRAG